MQNVLFIINKLDLLIRQSLSKFSRNRIDIYNSFKRDNKDKEKDKSITKKKVCNKEIAKIMRTNNALLTNMLIVYNRSNKSKNVKLSLFKRFKNIKS